MKGQGNIGRIAMIMAAAIVGLLIAAVLLRLAGLI